jgi:hypothetical protein
MGLLTERRIGRMYERKDGGEDFGSFHYRAFNRGFEKGVYLEVWSGGGIGAEEELDGVKNEAGEYILTYNPELIARGMLLNNSTISMGVKEGSIPDRTGVLNASLRLA